RSRGDHLRSERDVAHRGLPIPARVVRRLHDAVHASLPLTLRPGPKPGLLLGMRRRRLPWIALLALLPLAASAPSCSCGSDTEGSPLATSSTTASGSPTGTGGASSSSTSGDGGSLFDGGNGCTNGEPCDGGICAGGVCCDPALACDTACCNAGQVCS